MNTQHYACPYCENLNVVELKAYLEALDPGRTELQTDCFHCDETFFIKVNINFTIQVEPYETPKSDRFQPKPCDDVNPIKAWIERYCEPGDPLDTECGVLLSELLEWSKQI